MLASVSKRVFPRTVGCDAHFYLLTSWDASNRQFDIYCQVIG